MVMLAVKASVKVFIRVSPNRVYLNGYEGQVLTKTLNIIARKEEPLQLEPGGFNLSEKVTYRIETIEPGKIFKVHFRSGPALPGTFMGYLKLKTNYPEKPEIYIPIKAKFKKKAVSKVKNSSTNPKETLQHD